MLSEFFVFNITNFDSLLGKKSYLRTNIAYQIINI